MIRILSSIVLISTSLSQDVDEIEILVQEKKEFISVPDFIYKDNGLWYNSELDVPYTGRLKIYNKAGRIKLAECTFVDGMKNGILVQYYNELEMIDGIIGLYVNDKKEGNWIWLQPDGNWRDQIKKNLDYQILTSIDYRDGIKYGDIQIHKINVQLYDDLNNISYENNSIILRGHYTDGLQAGEWFYFDNIYSDFDLLVRPSDMYENESYWTRRQIYESGQLIQTECREPYKEVDCGYFDRNHGTRKFNFISNKDSDLENYTTNQIQTKNYLQDDNGLNVEINLSPFIDHIEEFHYEIGSVHKERGHSFTVNQNLRNKLYNMINSNN